MKWFSCPSNLTPYIHVEYMMTVFTVNQAVNTQDLVQKKLVYHYLCFYAVVSAHILITSNISFFTKPDL